MNEMMYVEDIMSEDVTAIYVKQLHKGFSRMSCNEARHEAIAVERLFVTTNAKTYRLMIMSADSKTAIIYNYDGSIRIEHVINEFKGDWTVYSFDGKVLTVNEITNNK